MNPLGAVIHNSQMSSGYRTDLAQIHDSGYSESARAAVPAILRLLDKQRIRTGRVVELGCGSGWTAKGFLDAGYEVVGVDQSPALIELARARAPQARLQTCSLFDFEIPACQCVVSIGECCNYLFDPHNYETRLPLLFARVLDALVPGGCSCST